MQAYEGIISPSIIWAEPTNLEPAYLRFLVKYFRNKAINPQNDQQSLY